MGVGAAEHRVFLFLINVEKSGPFSTGRTRSRKKSGSSFEAQESNAARIVDIFIEHAGNLRAGECVASVEALLHPPNAMNCMNSRTFDRCGRPSFIPPFSLRSGGSGRDALRSSGDYTQR